MILIDTSAWIEFLRNTGSPTCIAVEEAALLYRQARTSGHTVRRLIDCLIASIAIDNVVPLLQVDRDVTALTHCSALRLASPV